LLTLLDTLAHAASALQAFDHCVIQFNGATKLLNGSLHARKKLAYALSVACYNFGACVSFDSNALYHLLTMCQAYLELMSDDVPIEQLRLRSGVVLESLQASHLDVERHGPLLLLGLSLKRSYLERAFEGGQVLGESHARLKQLTALLI